MKNQPQNQLPIHRMAVFTPGRLNDEEVMASYIARQSQLDLILEDIQNTRPGGIPQHHLIIGQRGMGKTTLLMRLHVAIRQHPLADNFIPLGFPEEQYSVDRLSTLFLNCLDALADTLEREGSSQDILKRIDATVQKLRTETASDELVAQDAERALSEYTAETGRRPVLLIDNLNMVFSRLNKPELHQLRAFLMKNGAPVLIGAAVHPPENEYETPFYDHFKPHFLSRLSLAEMREVLIKLAERTGNKQIPARLNQQEGRLHALHSLTGGNPRTTRILFEIFAHGFSQEAYQDLEALLDWMTPIYKARFEELSDQAQVVVSAIATIWEPAVQKTICEVTRLQPNQVSPQLDRLKKAGVIEEITVDPPNRVGPIPDRRTPKDRKGYQLAERFFNIWFLMRQATRRDKKNLIHLTRFIECWFSPEERTRLAEDILMKKELTKGERAYGLALEHSIQKESLRLRLRDHLLGEFIRAKKMGIEKIEELIDLDEIPQQRWAIEELREKIRSAVPHETGMDASEFAELILRIPRFVGRREEIAAKPLSAEQAGALMREAQKNLEDIISAFGEPTGMWLTSLFQEGIMTDARNPNEIEDAILRADSKDKIQACMLLATINPSTIRLGNKAFEATSAYLRPEDSSTDASAWFEWAEKCAFLFERKCEAIAACERALELDPNHAAAARKIAFYLDETNHTDQEILDIYNKAVSLNPDDDYLLTKLGGILYEKFGRIYEAKDILQKSLKSNPDNARTWFKLSHLQLDYLGDLKSGVNSMNRAVELEPDSSFYWSQFADTLSEIPGKESETIEYYNNALKISPEDEYYILKLGSFLSKFPDRRQEGIDLIRKATNLHPNSIFARSQLASLLDENEETQNEAFDHWLEVIKQDPANTGAWLSIALYLLKHGRDNEFHDFVLTAVKTADRWMHLRMIRTFGVFSGRPHLGRELFEAIRNVTPKETRHELLFDEVILNAAEDNWGKTSDAFSELIQRLGERMVFPKQDRESWMDMSAVILFYGHGDKLLQHLAKIGVEQRLRPWSEALRAHVRGDRKYLRNAPAEARESAGKLLDEIDLRLQQLTSVANNAKPATPKSHKSK